MSYFNFVDMSKLLPYTESACPEGICSESIQILMRIQIS